MRWSDSTPTTTATATSVAGRPTYRRSGATSGTRSARTSPASTRSSISRPCPTIHSEIWSPSCTYDINHRATVQLARVAREAGVRRFVFSSSCSNYGAAEDRLLDESASFNPITPYGISKVRAEQDLLALASDDFSPVLLRSATAYGVSPRLRCDIVLNNLTAWAVATGRVLIKSDGSAWRPIVHVEDIGRAFIAALEAPREVVHSQAFNVARVNENYRISDLAEIVRETVPGCRIEYAGGASADARNYRVDASKIARMLPAFKPRWTARDGARELYEAFEAARITVDDFEGFRFRRIGQITRLLASGRLDPSLRWRAERVPELRLTGAP